MKQWNEIFKQYGNSYTTSQDHLPKIVDYFRKNNVKKILDLGCGAGAHVVYLAKQGFDVYGVDVAEEGIKIARRSLRENRLKAHLKIGSIYKRLPYKNNFFDAVISLRVIHHGGIGEIRRVIREIKRILRPKGLIFVTVRKKIPKGKRSRFKVIAPRTYVPEEGEEKGIVHYLFNKELLIKEFKDFKIKDFWIDAGHKSWESYYCLLGELIE